MAEEEKDEVLDKKAAKAQEKAARAEAKAQKKADRKKAKELKPIKKGRGGYVKVRLYDDGKLSESGK